MLLRSVGRGMPDGRWVGVSGSVAEGKMKDGWSHVVSLSFLRFHSVPELWVCEGSEASVCSGPEQGALAVSSAAPVPSALSPSSCTI